MKCIIIEDQPPAQRILKKFIDEIGSLELVKTFSEATQAMDFLKDNEVLRNACTEVTSEDDGDKCNLGTIWMNRIDTKEEFAEVVRVSTIFLLCGSKYSHVPTDKIKEVGEKNNRIGLGLGGMHEWLMVRGYKYQVTPELHKWLNIYEQESDSAAYIYSKELGMNIPLGKRAIAPTGTISNVVLSFKNGDRNYIGVSGGIEPIFSLFYRRRSESFND